MMLIILLGIVGAAVSQCSFNGVQRALNNDLDDLHQAEGAAAASADDAMDRTEGAISTGRTLMLAIGILGVVVAVVTIIRLTTIGIRSVALEVWIRRMGAGDLDYRVEMQGKDEIVELAIALEELRQRSIRAMQLNLVEKLSRGLQEKNDELERVVEELQRTQEQIILRQKLVELGELTAGVAHEIRNPLNFVKNFSEASEELLVELRGTLDESMDKLDDETRGTVADISQELTGNMERIRSHIDRANRIVRDMIIMGHGGGEAQLVEINELLRKHALLAFHSASASDNDFQLEIRHEFDPNVGEVSVVPAEMGRVFLNIVGNACYATDEKRQFNEDSPTSYVPTLWLKTKRHDDTVEIRIRDNGTGIPSDVVDRIFNPFFTTKPAGKATGLGLSLSDDIVRQHGGSITPVTELGAYTEMVISLPVSGVLAPASE